MPYTYTYAILELSPTAYKEIRDKLVEAGYGDQVVEHRTKGEIIDMRGLAVTEKPESSVAKAAREGFNSR